MTLKTYKAALTTGLRWKVLEHWNPKLQGTERVVGQVRTNGYGFTSPTSDQRMGAPAPQACELSSDGHVARIDCQDTTGGVKKSLALAFPPAVDTVTLAGAVTPGGAP